MTLPTFRSQHTVRVSLSDGRQKILYSAAHASASQSMELSVMHD